MALATVSVWPQVLAGAIGLRDGMRLAANPQTSNRASITWSAPQTSLLSPLTGLPLTGDSMGNSVALGIFSRVFFRIARVDVGFRKEGAHVILVTGNSPKAGNAMRQPVVGPGSKLRQTALQ